MCGAGVGELDDDRRGTSVAHPDGLRPLAGIGFRRDRARLPPRRPFGDDRLRLHLLRPGMALPRVARRPQADAAVHRARLQRCADQERRGPAPHLLFVCKGQLVEPRAIEAAKAAGALAALWWPDVSFFAHGPSIPRTVPHYDWVFTTKTFGLANSREIRHDARVVPAARLPPGGASQVPLRRQRPRALWLRRVVHRHLVAEEAGSAGSAGRRAAGREAEDLGHAVGEGRAGLARWVSRARCWARNTPRRSGSPRSTSAS